MQVQAQAMQALQTKPMPKAGVGNAAKSAKPKVAKVQQKKMPRKPQAPPQQAQTSAKAAKAVEKQGRAIPVKRMPFLKRAASWDAASVVSAATVVVPQPVPKAKGSVSTQLQSLWHRLTGRPGSEAVESAARPECGRKWSDCAFLPCFTAFPTPKQQMRKKPFQLQVHCQCSLRGPSRGFVHLRGVSWAFVGLRGASGSFVGLCGASWNLPGPWWLEVARSWTFEVRPSELH